MSVISKVKKKALTTSVKAFLGCFESLSEESS